MLGQKPGFDLHQGTCRPTRWNRLIYINDINQWTDEHAAKQRTAVPCWSPHGPCRSHAKKVCFFIVKAREFDVKDVVTDPDSGSNPSDDAMISVLEDHADDPTHPYSSTARIPQRNTVCRFSTMSGHRFSMHR